MCLKVLLACDGNRKFKIIDILSDLNRLLKISFLDVVADNGDLRPLGVVVTDLED